MQYVGFEYGSGRMQTVLGGHGPLEQLRGSVVITQWMGMGKLDCGRDGLIIRMIEAIAAVVEGEGGGGDEEEEEDGMMMAPPIVDSFIIFAKKKWEKSGKIQEK